MIKVNWCEVRSELCLSELLVGSLFRLTNGGLIYMKISSLMEQRESTADRWPVVALTTGQLSWVRKAELVIEMAGELNIKDLR